MKALLDDLQTVWSIVENATDEEIRLMNSIKARVAELESEKRTRIYDMVEAQMIAEDQRDRYRRTLERLRDAEDCPAIVKAIVNESLNL